MSFKKFFKNISKKFNKKQKKEDTFESNWNNFQKEENEVFWSTGSIIDNENYFESLLPIVEQENQFDIINLKFYTQYDEYIYEIRRKELEKYYKFKMYFSFLEAHIRSQANLQGEGKKYYQNSCDILLHRVKQYEEDFEFCFSILNKKFNTIYLLDLDDLLNYANKYLIY